MPSYVQGTGSNRPDYHREGIYDFAVIGAADKVAASGNDMIELKLEIIGPDIEEGKGAIVYENLVFTEAAFFKIDQFLASVGEEIQEGKEVTIESSDLVGRSGRCSLIVETYKGRTRNKVAKFIAADDDETPF